MLKQPLFQKENRVYRTYQGGRQLELFLGKPCPTDSFQPEDWISSFVEAKNKHYIPGEGISKILLNEEEKLITEVITPEDFGPGRTESGVLIKLLDAHERLGIQVHPTPAFSEKYFGTKYGKTECWHILETDKSADSAIYIGFKEGVTKERWTKLFEEQNIEEMLSCLHRFEVQKGDTILVTAGTPHAIGAGCFLLEIQEPCDYTMRVEKTTVAGEKLTPMQIHYGVGEEHLLDCFIYEGLSAEKAREKYFLTPEIIPDKAEGANVPGTERVRVNHSSSHCFLVSYKNTSCFALEKIAKGGITVSPGSFVTLVVTENGTIEIGENAASYTVKRGDKIFIPFGCGTITVVDAEVILCYPPQLVSPQPNSTAYRKYS